MIKIHYINTHIGTYKCAHYKYRRKGFQKAGDLLEVRFVHGNNHEKLFKIDGFLHYDGPYKVDSPELNTMEKKQWLLGVLYDELQSHVASKENAADYRLSYLNKFGDKSLLPQPQRSAVVLTLNNFSKVHIVHQFTDVRNSIDFTREKEWFEQQLTNDGISDFDLRIHIPILWNETLQMWNVYRQGDMCRVRFVYSPDLEWYNNHLEGFVEHFKDFPLWH